MTLLTSKAHIHSTAWEVFEQFTSWQLWWARGAVGGFLGFLWRAAYRDMLLFIVGGSLFLQCCEWLRLATRSACPWAPSVNHLSPLPKSHSLCQGWPPGPAWPCAVLAYTAFSLPCGYSTWGACPYFSGWWIPMQMSALCTLSAPSCLFPLCFV